MQHNLIQATVDINKYIISNNDKNGMPTPRLAKKIIKKSGKSRKTHRVCYAKLPDGVHPIENTAEKWINIISLTILVAKRPDLFRNGYYIGNEEHYKPSEHLPNITSAHLPDYLPPGQQTPAQMKRNLIQWKDNGALTKPIGEYHPIIPTYNLLVLLNIPCGLTSGARVAQVVCVCVCGGYRWSFNPLHSGHTAWMGYTPEILLANSLSAQLGRK